MREIVEDVLAVAAILESKDVAASDVILKHVVAAVHEHPKGAVQGLSPIVISEIEVTGARRWCRRLRLLLLNVLVIRWQRRGQTLLRQGRGARGGRRVG